MTDNHSVNPLLQEKSYAFLGQFKGLILDVDGVWFSGEESRLVLSSGEVAVVKSRSHQDGQGLSFIRALGIEIVFTTGEGEPMNSIVQKLNTLPSVVSGDWKTISLFTKQLQKGGKVESIENWLKAKELTWEDCAYIGDDRTDFEAMSMAGLKVAPANATRVIRKIADIVLEKEGGKGAIREFAEMTLDSRGVDESNLPSA